MLYYGIVNKNQIEVESVGRLISKALKEKIQVEGIKAKVNLLKLNKQVSCRMKKYKDKIEDFFKWVKGTELVELDDIDVSEDPVRPGLTLGFRIMHGRKIFSKFKI